MEKVTESEKNTLGKKFLEFQKTGLVAYGKYLADQLEIASKSGISKAYKKYIEDQIEINKRKINEIDEKLK
ncbi:MAG: hypothetical protein ACI81S_000783 [Sphingobacteriales bacterium]|jgi:hypothetical protein